MIERSGADIDRFLPFAQRSAEAFGFFMAEGAAAAKHGGRGDEASARMMVAGADHIIETGAEVGVNIALSQTVRELWRAVAAAESAPTLYELLRGDSRGSVPGVR